MIRITNEIAATYVRFKTFAALKIFSLSSLKINNWASSADIYELKGKRVTEVPSSVSFSECREPLICLKDLALSVSFVKFSISNKSSSASPNYW